MKTKKKEKILKENRKTLEGLVKEVERLKILCDHTRRLVTTDPEVTVKIHYLTDEIEELRYIEGKSDWIDLRSAAEVELKAGTLASIPLGVAMEIPEGYEAIIAPRSSSPKNFKIIQANSIGIIDESYCGDNDEWRMMVYPFENGIIHKNDRICQFRLVKHQPKVNFMKMDTLGNKDRGGFGSTGQAQPSR